jgi:hypothetical protein
MVKPKHWSGSSSVWKNLGPSIEGKGVASRALITRLAERIEDLAEFTASRQENKMLFRLPPPIA